MHEFGQLDQIGVRRPHLRSDPAKARAACLEVGQQVLGGLNACISHQQGSFEFFIEVVINLGTREHGTDALARATKALAQSSHPARAWTLGWHLL